MDPAPMDPALVILAAGASERLGEAKALVDLGGRRALDRLVAASVPVLGFPLVVAGPHHALIHALAPPGCEVVENPRWRSGRTGSAALAAALRPGRDLCLAPVDVPLVPEAVFAALAAAWRSAGFPARGWLAPRRGRRFGHPIVIGREIASELAGLEESSPLRAMRARAEPLLSVEVESEAVFDDLDSPEDLARIRARFERRT